MLGLIGEVTRLPWSRYYNDRADISQLASNTLGHQGLVLLFAFCSLWAYAKNNRVKGLIRSRYMDLVNSWVIPEIGPLRRSSLHYAQQTRLNQSTKNLSHQCTT